MPIEITHDLPNLKFDGKGEITTLEHTSRFLEFYDSRKVDCEDVVCRLFTFTFKACIKQWHYTFLTASIHSFEQLVKEFYLAFNWYNYEDVYKNIIHLKIKYDDSIEDFHDQLFTFFMNFMMMILIIIL